MPVDAKKTALGVAICGGLTFLGVLLPWYELSFLSLNGTQGDYSGTLTLLLGLVGGAAALVLRRGPPAGFPLGAYPLALVALGAFGLATVVTLVDLLAHGPGRVFAGRRSPFSGGTGFGIYLTMGAAAAGAWFAWKLFKATPLPPPSTPPTSPGAPPPPPSGPGPVPPAPPPSSPPPPPPPPSSTPPPTP